MPLQISAYALAKATNIPQTRISQIVHKQRRITADTALRFGKFFASSPEFWLNLQTSFDLAQAKQESLDQINQIQQFSYKNNA